MCDPAWRGLPVRVVATGVLGALMWTMFSVWLFWEYRPRYDDFFHTLWARWWIAGEYEELARNWPGTLIRPYVYHAFLGLIGHQYPDIFTYLSTRLNIGIIQSCLFVIMVFRLAQKALMHHQQAPYFIICGLLISPFAIITNNEILSESISLSTMTYVIMCAIPDNAGRDAKFGNVAGTIAGLALLAMVRTAQLPVAIAATAMIAAIMVPLGIRQSAADTVRRACVVAAGVLAWCVIVAPQAALMWGHTRLEPGDTNLFGVGAGQLLWSQQMGKYATVVAPCAPAPVAGVAYPIPFTDSLTATGSLTWYATSPHVAAWHLFQSLNWDFPSTYISTFNPFITVTMNSLGLATVVVGFMTVVNIAPRLIPWLIRKAPVLGIVLGAIVALWLQTAFTAVETRFGVIPWSALSVAAAYGAKTWWEDARAGHVRVGWLGTAVGLTLVALVVSRLAVGSVPAFQQLEAVGCWR